MAPGEIAVVPRGIRFAVELPDGDKGPARGYLCENFGAAFTLPQRGPIGANGLANERDFLAPSAAYQDRPGTVQVVQKFGGNLRPPTTTTHRSTSWAGTGTTRRTSTTRPASW